MKINLRVSNSPHNLTCGKFVVGIFLRIFLLINIEKISVFKKKTRILMKNVHYLFALVLKTKYTNKCEGKSDTGLLPFPIPDETEFLLFPHFFDTFGFWTWGRTPDL
jgi:hypothetical protein